MATVDEMIRNGRLTQVGRKFRVRELRKGQTRTFAVFECACGSRVILRHASVKSDNGLSCGCLGAEMKAERSRTHGRSHTAEYKIWEGIKRRCLNPNQKNYADYGGRGITMCDRWLNSFQLFFDDMGSRPSERHSIDRINNNGNYEPSNCQWATLSHQARHKRNSRLITIGGKTQCQADWADEAGIDQRMIHARIKLGWTAEDAIRTPIGVARKMQ